MIKLWDNYIITVGKGKYIMGKWTTDAEIPMSEVSFHDSLTDALSFFHKKRLIQFIDENDCTLSTAWSFAMQVENRITRLINEPHFDAQAPIQSTNGHSPVLNY